MKTVALCVVMAVTLLLLVTQGDAVCCGAKGAGKTCGDCTKAAPYCGWGKCNLFGCQCVGGCRAGQCYNWQRRSLEDEMADIVSLVDMNGDGALSLDEAASHLEKRGEHLATAKRALLEMDQDRDGFLAAHEIDSDLVSHE